MPNIEEEEIIAVGISGGPDSFALLKLLSEWSYNKNVKIIAITVDHNLRDESAAEAAYVGKLISNWTNVEHVILKWEGDKPKSSIMEEARKFRYKLMSEYLNKNNGKYLFIGHHMDDQAETVLFRLCKGSGIKGLSGIRDIQKTDDMLVIRPLLNFTKQELIDICKHYKIKFITDPSNTNEDYTRPRLRSLRNSLANEGLSAKRLSKLAQRMNNCENALDHYAEKLVNKARSENEAILLNMCDILSEPSEIRNRAIIKIIGLIGKNKSDYGVRLHRAETALDEVFSSPTTTTRTIGGCLVKKDRKNNLLKVSKEFT